MIEVRKSEFAGTMPDLGVSFVQASSDATRRLCEQGQSVAKTISEWNTEVSHFLSHRVAHNGETLGRMTKCQNLQEVFAIQAQWVREAADDYLKEMRKLMEANSRIMSGMPGSLGLVGTQSFAEMPTPPVPQSAFETAVSTDARPASETFTSPEVRLGPETRTQPPPRLSPARSTAKAED
ncbi:MAG: phasin family protein [Acetobacteraceae bacterium]